MFFDLHCHPSFKSFLSDRKEHRRSSCWEKMTFQLNFNILNSQSSFKQLIKGDVRLAVATLYGLEWGFARSGLIKLAAGLSDNIQKRFLQDIEKKEFGYNELLHAEHRHLINCTNSRQLNEVMIVNNMKTDFHPENGKLHLILAAEGGHNFYDDHQIVVDPKKVLANLRFFKDSSNPRLLYITLTHLTHSEFCTHAFGMKMINHPVFYPVKKGLTALGKDFIREALNKTGRRIFIDIKHMSLISRIQFYKLRNVEFPDAPIIASHMGVNGLSYMKKPVKNVVENPGKNCVEVYYFRNPGVIDTYFNPWSINLYDEDIIEIAKSQGLIGISLDQRILGLGNVSKELFSPEEFKAGDFKKVRSPAYHKLNKYDYRNKKQIRQWHCRHLCNNLIHTVKVGKEVVGEKIWKHICIGSDFDGLIDPIDVVRSAGQYPDLYSIMVEQLPIVAAAAGVKLPSNQVQAKIKGFFYQNAIDFLNKNYV